jgi:hypothetical protein
MALPVSGFLIGISVTGLRGDGNFLSSHVALSGQRNRKQGFLFSYYHACLHAVVSSSMKGNWFTFTTIHLCGSARLHHMLFINDSYDVYPCTLENCQGVPASVAKHLLHLMLIRCDMYGVGWSPSRLTSFAEDPNCANTSSLCLVQAEVAHRWETRKG